MKYLIMLLLIFAIGACTEPSTSIKCTVYAIGLDGTNTDVGSFDAVDNSDVFDQCEDWSEEYSDICSVWCDCEI